MKIENVYIAWHMHVIILAGGLGSRLWPLSRENFPKQFLHLGGGNSLLKQTVERISKHPAIRKIVVSTNSEVEALVREDLAGLDAKLDIGILVEPFRRNTAPAIGLAIRYLEEVFGMTADEPVLILPSDHFIHPEVVFLEHLTHCLTHCAQGMIVTFGIRPTRPETGYGYIRAAEKIDSCCHWADAFVEKPNLAKAIEYMGDFRYYWNSGMVAFTPAIFWAEVDEHCPQIGSLRTAAWRDMAASFQVLEGISIDYALLEKSERVAVCPLPVFWADIGSWENVYELMDKDHNSNAKVGNVVALGTKNCLIIGGKRVISTIGLEDLVIIDTDDAILISRKNESQRVMPISLKESVAAPSMG